MKAVFVHDHKFVCNPADNLIYDGSGGVFDENLWKRYLAVFDELVVVGREVNSLPNRLNLSSYKNVSFSLIKNSDSIKGRILHFNSIMDTIEQTILDSDFVIIRVPSFLGALAFKLCVKHRVNYLLEVVADPFYSLKYHGSFYGKILAPYERYKLKSILYEAENVIYVTQLKLQKVYPNPNNNIGISNVRLLDTAIENEVIKFYKEKKNEYFTIGLIGTFHAKYKGHVELLKAIRYLKTKGYTKIQVLLVGTGDSEWVDRLLMKSEIGDQFRILGALDSGDNGIVPFLDSLDCYVHPSLTEGLPRVVIEAMSRGKLCLTSDAGGVKELLDERFIHKAGDWLVLANQIKEIVDLDCDTKIEYALNNLNKSKLYLEDVLQSRRMEFIKNIIDYDGVETTN